MLRKLRKGMHLTSRIILVLGHNRYLLRIYGYNLIMESTLKFNRFDEIHIEVLHVRPKLKLRFIHKNTFPYRPHSSHKKTDIRI